MEYHLERKIILSEDSKFKNLYSWFLREVDSEGKEQRDQIPWRWTLYFMLSDITFFSSLSADRYSTSGDNEERMHQRDFIVANLAPNDTHNVLNSRTSYSMFGTRREISNLSLSIYKVGAEAEETCSAWGGVSYTTDIDFRDVTSDDTIMFSMHVKAERFARYVQQIAEKSLTRGTFRVGEVDGFYSDWSPAISTSWIKVLTNDTKEHAVEIPVGCSIVPPRLGRVGTFELTLSSETRFSLPATNDIDDVVHDNEPTEVPDDTLKRSALPQFVPVAAPTTISILKSLRAAAWVIAALLLVLILKR